MTEPIPVNTWNRTPGSAVVDDRYAAEVDRCVERGRMRWESEQNALAAAERRRERLAHRVPKTAREKKLTRHKIRQLDEQIEMHRRYLQSVYHLMVKTGAPSPNRGAKSFRPIPKIGDVI